METERATEIVHGLFESWYSCAVRHAYRATGSLDAAEDIVQESFQALYMELVGGLAVTDPKRWTLCCMRRAIGKYWRGRSRHPVDSLTADAWDTMPAPEGDGLESSILWSEVREKFSVLTAREEEVLLLRMQGFRYAEIAADLDIGFETVKTLLTRALTKLRKATQNVSKWPEDLADEEGHSRTLH